MSERAARRRALREVNKKAKVTHRAVTVVTINPDGSESRVRRLAPMEDINRMEREQSVKHGRRVRVSTVVIDNREKHEQQNRTD